MVGCSAQNIQKFTIHLVINHVSDYIKIITVSLKWSIYLRLEKKYPLDLSFHMLMFFLVPYYCTLLQYSQETDIMGGGGSHLDSCNLQEKGAQD